MKRAALLLIPLLTTCTRSAPAPQATAPAKAEAHRRFQIRTSVQLEGLPIGRALRLWVPVPTDDAHQRITGIVVESPWTYRRSQRGPVGMLFLEGQTEGPRLALELRYEVARVESSGEPIAAADDGAALGQFLAPSQLVVVDSALGEHARRLASSAGGPRRHARAFYEHVLGAMDYDKSGSSWGRGDSVYACSVGKGNCTDYHAYFMALCLAQRIPCRFQIGLYGPYERRPEAVALTGYHCWAEFAADGRWVPVDISEADKNPNKAEYFFGHHSPNRVTLSTGRDIVLEPAQAGPPLNFFINPYAVLTRLYFENPPDGQV